MCELADNRAISSIFLYTKVVVCLWMEVECGSGNNGEGVIACSLTLNTPSLDELAYLFCRHLCKNMCCDYILPAVLT